MHYNVGVGLHNGWMLHILSFILLFIQLSDRFCQYLNDLIKMYRLSGFVVYCSD